MIDPMPAAPAPTLTFRATIAIRGINPYVPVSATQAARLMPGWRKAMPVRVQVNGQPEDPWRINLMPAGDGGFYLYLHASVRDASGTAVGDRVRVALWFDEDYRGGPPDDLPPWFEAALNAHRPAARAYAALPPSRQKELARHMARLKTDAARDRNLAQALAVLSGEPGRFMARDWTDGR